MLCVLYFTCILFLLCNIVRMSRCNKRLHTYLVNYSFLKRVTETKQNLGLQTVEVLVLVLVSSFALLCFASRSRPWYPVSRQTFQNWTRVLSRPDKLIWSRDHIYGWYQEVWTLQIFSRTDRPSLHVNRRCCISCMRQLRAIHADVLARLYGSKDKNNSSTAAAKR